MGFVPGRTFPETNDVAVELSVFEEIHFHFLAVAGEVVSRQVHEHRVFRIFFRVGEQRLSGSSVCLLASCSACRSGDGVDERHPVVFDAAVRLRRRAEDAEATEVKVEEIGRRVDASKCPIECKIVPFKLLHEAS